MSSSETLGAWDYVIAGGGLAGVVVASRLAEDSSIRVLLLEAGEEKRSPLLSIPAGETLLLGNPGFDWRFATVKDPTLGGRHIPIPRGRLLGGSNAINGMLFVRGQRDDYDTWQRSGLTGWGWDDVLPYFRKLEDWAGGASDTRGQGGPIRVELPRQTEVLCDAFIKAGQENGFPLNYDYNSGDQEGFGYYQCTQRAGRRHSVIDGYLCGARPNLTVLTRAHAIRLNIAEGRCTGIEFLQTGRELRAHAHREVIVCAGVIGSPQLLELSGIGDPKALIAAGIEPRVESPKVGENFRDHFAARLKWRVRAPVTFNERTRGLRMAGQILRYLISKRGVLALPIAIGFGFVRSRATEPVPDLQFHFAPGSYGEGSARRLERQPGMTIGVYPSRPNSKGSVHIINPDPYTAPAIRTRFLDDAEDVRRLISGIKIARRVADAPALKPYVAHALTPNAGQSDAEIVDFLRDTGSTSFHPVGTCGMGAVVDGQMRVRGVRALRVIDASVMPTMVSGNTQAATTMIAERGADFVKRGG